MLIVWVLVGTQSTSPMNNVGNPVSGSREDPVIVDSGETPSIEPPENPFRPSSGSSRARWPFIDPTKPAEDHSKWVCF